ncbi:MAG: YfcE family phosphodiesterase [Oscillospiraceae bacterium]|nr:YfcE family phosphodiesterase [Oscillospiraceae bacterium]
MARILVFSDSHAGLSFMRHCIKKIQPDAIIHLGDYYDDGQTVSEEFPHIPFHAVPGNCDKYRLLRPVPEILCYDVCGVRLFMTHGHKHNVKITTGLLLADAARNNAAVALYGHTHKAECRCLPDGMWLLNPGACGSFGGSAGVIETEQGKINACYLINSMNLEEMI